LRPHLSLLAFVKKKGDYANIEEEKDERERELERERKREIERERE
jgi:hypothetical protein